ncbi:MAG TPA: GAF domain-containing protein [Acidimicrobiales bacterium]|nr:GAF domain-containing protein [Acidimicrobiales bacterium]
MAEGSRDEIEILLEADRAARIAGESVARWWKEHAEAAASEVTSDSLDELLRDALDSIRRGMAADAVALLLADESEGELVARAATGLAEEVTISLGIRAGEGMAGQVMARRRPQVFDDLSQIHIVSPVLRNSGLRSVVAAPLVSEGRVLGVIYAGSRQLANFTGADAHILELIANQVAGAFRRVQLFEAEHSARTEAEQLAARLGQMQAVTSALVGTSSVEETASVLAESMTSHAHRHEGRWGSVWVIREDNIELASDLSLSPGAAGIGQVPLDSRLPLAEAVRRRQAIYVTDAAQAVFEYPSLAEYSDIAKSFAVLPMVVGEACLGALVIAFETSHEFSDAERAFFGAVVDQAAQALDRASLYTQLSDLADMSAFFAEAAKVLAEAPSFADTLERLATLALAALGDICLIDVVDERGELQRMVARHRDPTFQHLVDLLRTHYPPRRDGPHPAAEVSRVGTTSWSAQMTDAYLRSTTLDQHHFEITKALGFKSYLAVPLKSGDELLGSLTFVSTGRPFSSRHVAFAEGLAQQVAAVVDSSRRSEAALTTSRILQESLLPHHLPEIPGLWIDTRYLAATRGLEVGGDFYDLMLLPSRRVGFSIGDVAGHDRHAAALMGQIRSAARALAGQVDSPAELIAALRWSWDLLDADRITTALFAELDPATGELMMASAGHYPPLLIARGMTEFLPVPPTTPLGTPDSPVHQWSGTLKRGEVLLLYTDGAIDERSAGSEASMARLAEVASGGELNPTSVCTRIVDFLDEDRIDDVALLALALD